MKKPNKTQSSPLPRTPAHVQRRPSQRVAFGPHRPVQPGDTDAASPSFECCDDDTLDNFTETGPAESTHQVLDGKCCEKEDEQSRRVMDTLEAAIKHFETQTKPAQKHRPSPSCLPPAWRQKGSPKAPHESAEELRREYNGLLRKYEELVANHSWLQQSYTMVSGQLEEMRQVILWLSSSNSRTSDTNRR